MKKNFMTYRLGVFLALILLVAFTWFYMESWDAAFLMGMILLVSAVYILGLAIEKRMQSTRPEFVETGDSNE